MMSKIVFPVYVNDFAAAVTFFRKTPFFDVSVKHDWGVGQQADVNYVGGAAAQSKFKVLLIEARSDGERSYVGRQAPPEMWLLSIPVSGLKQMREQLFGAGVNVSDIQNFPWGSVAFMTDLVGNRYMLSEDFSED